MKRVLVTGGVGFLGRHVCERLLGDGWEVICVDNFYTGAKRNVLSFLDDPAFELIRHDICQPLYLEVDAIYHLACPASPVQYSRNPVQTIKTAVQGTCNMLGLARRLGVPMLQASTSEVYGDPQCHPQEETYWGHVNPIGDRSCYDEGKRCAESLCFSYRQEYGVRTRVARIFNTYGPYMQVDDGRVVSNFIIQALRNEPITLYGDGSQSRSFCFVSDLVDGLTRLMEVPDERLPGPVNLGNPAETTVLELAETVIRLTGSHSRIQFHPLPEDDPRKRRPDIRRARTILDWEPRVGLDAGLEATIQYMDDLLNRADVSAGNGRGPLIRQPA